MQPVVFIWKRVNVVDDDGVITAQDVMVPHKRYHNVATSQYAHDAEYPLTLLEARSRASHNHYMASVEEGWLNLPETMAPEFPTSTHLRYWCLIETGWYDKIEFRVSSPGEAIAQEIEINRKHPYARVTIGKVMRYGVDGVPYWPGMIQFAKSQSAKEMTKQEFEASKIDVLDMISALIGVPRSQWVKREKRKKAA